jgi:leucyl-tRNA synthetase
MDTFVDSSWYFYRYCDPANSKLPFARGPVDAWFPIDLYIGGIEHATGHLIYCRFFTKFMRDLGLLGFDEPVENLLTQGMVVSWSHFCEEHRYLFPNEVRTEGEGGSARFSCGRCGRPVTRVLEKMSKSKNNIVDPDAAVDRFGADAIRIFALFASPPDAEVQWTEQGMEGGYRFLARLWRFIDRHRRTLIAAPSPSSASGGALDDPSGRALALRRRTHRTIRRVTDDIARRLQFNTALAALMELLNAIYEFHDREAVEPVEAAALAEAVRTLVSLLAPFAPHTCEEIWERLGGQGGLANGRWPEADPALLEEDSALVVVQVNGRLRGRITVRRGAPEAEVVAAARADGGVAAAVGEKAVRKVVLVPDRLLNLVLG